tara:strand:- start:148 stop:447 length:300 start_codon:yes stop_codon:yes gene_type:complete
MVSKEKGVYIYANLLDTNLDGKIDMISFLDPNGRGIALAVDRSNKGKLDQIHMLQDVTGDGILDNDDKIIIERESMKIFKNKHLKEGQLKLFVNDAKYG